MYTIQEEIAVLDEDSNLVDWFDTYGEAEAFVDEQAAEIGASEQE